MVKANPSLSLRTGSLDLPKADLGAIAKRFSPAIWADPDVVPYAARVSVWGRWFIVLVSAFEIAYRPGFWYPDGWGFVLLLVPLATLNGLVHFRLLTNRPVTWRWMLLLSAMDIALATASITLGPGFDSYVFVAYYPALALFAVVFTSLWLSLAWTTMTAVAYTFVCWTVGAGLDSRCGRREGAGGQVGGDVRPCAVRQSHHPVRTHEKTDRGGRGAEGATGAHRVLPGGSRHDRADRLPDFPGDSPGQGAGWQVRRGVGGRFGCDRGAVTVGHVGAETPHRRGPHLRGQGVGAGVVVALRDI